MAERKSYGQFCGLARGLDRVGDRWTLLIVRELLLGDQTFRQLEQALTGMSPSLLAKRLRDLVDDGLIVRSDSPRRSKKVEYRLTDSGRSLEPVIIELIRWGSTWMLNGPDGDRVDARWAPLALRALLGGEPAQRGRVHLNIDGVHVTVSITAGKREVTAGLRGHPDATVAAPLPVLLAIAAGAQTLARSGAVVAGDAAAAEALLTTTQPP